MATKEDGDAGRSSEVSVVSVREVSSSLKSCRSSRRFLTGSLVEKPPEPVSNGISDLVMQPINALIFCLPVGIAAYRYDWSELWIFWMIFLAMVPLAKLLGDITEELAAGLKNDMVAGLVNATFGNAVEMVITVQALRAGLFDVVKATLLGSVLSNMLLVLGCSFFFGGIVNNAAPAMVAKDSASPGTEYQQVQSAFMAEKVQTFDVLGAMVNTSMLLLSCLSFTLVTIFRSLTDDVDDESDTSSLLLVSRICSIIIASVYAAYIVFQLGTHSKAMASEDDGEDDADEPMFSVLTCTFLLFVTTTVVALASDLLVNAIEGVTEKAHISQHFIGIILLPIVGNACEHAAAVRFAMRDKPALSIAIAIGSSTQIALFVVPFSVVAGWVLGKDMDLNFGALNTTVMTLSVIVVLSMVVDGQSNWLQGYLLCAAYAVVAVLYWHLPNELTTIS